MSFQEELAGGLIPGMWPEDVEISESPIPILHYSAVRAAFLFGWSCWVVCFAIFGFAFGYMPWLSGFGTLFIVGAVAFNVGVFTLISYIVFIGFYIVSALWRVQPENVEKQIYNLYAFYFKACYEVSVDVKGTLTAKLAHENRVFTTVATWLSNVIQPVTSYVYKRRNRVSPLPPFTLHAPRSELEVKNFEQIVNEAEVPITDVVVVCLNESTSFNVWNDDDVARQVPLVRFACLMGRLIVLCRLDLRMIIIMAFTGLPITIMVSIAAIIRAGVKGLYHLWAGIRLWCIGLLMSIFMPTSVLEGYMWYYKKVFFSAALFVFTKLLNPLWWYLVYRFVKMCVAVVCSKLLLIYHFLSLLLERNQGSVKMISRKQRLVGRFNQTWVSLQTVVADLALPDYVKSFEYNYTPENLQATFDTLAKLGWPVNVRTMPDAEWSGPFQDWWFTKISFEQGIHNLQAHLDDDLATFEMDNNLIYKRTETYASAYNELQTTSRYFYRPEYQFSDIQLDDLWEVFGEIFAHSRLTPFNNIIRRWEKKYGLAPWAKVVTGPGKERKLARREFINQIGMKNFKKLWWETFKVAPSLVPISPVSVKREALPQKKWAFDKVRTVIGSPITSYIAATIWDYFPAHNFKWQTTPSKIGMPLNGWAMGKVFNGHALRDVHFAADCSAFDSTLTGPVLENITGMFKKGYESHRSFKAICDLIDSNAYQVEHGLLGLTSSGNVFKKGTGLSTGHSTTSLSNTVGMGALYLGAWRSITGKSAKIFKHFNTLSLYGDDNMISWTKDAPASWNFQNIQNVLKSWGVDLREEARGSLENIEFLSKFARRPTQKDVSEFHDAGLPIPDWVVYHNRDKLVGKIKAPVTSRQQTYKIKRLISFLDLTAGHRDIYDKLTAILAKKIKVARETQNDKSVWRIPTYNQVLANWYNPSSDFSSHDAEDDPFLVEADKSGLIVYGEVTIFDAFTNALARVIDIFNPDVYNSSLTNFVQRPFKKFLQWSLLFTAESNSAHTERHLATLVQKSAYDWVSNEVETIVRGDPAYATSRLIKHWAYMCFRSSGNSFFSSWMTATDKKLADLKYIVFGYEDLAIRRVDVPWWNIIVCSILGMIPELPLPDYREIPFLYQVCRFSFGSFVDQVFSMTMNFIWSITPPNFTVVIENVKSLVPGRPVVLEAPTGTGKSTAMINIIQRSIVKYDKIVVVEPRSKIVTDLVPFMRKKYSMSVTGLTQGMLYDPKERVIYATPMEVHLHREFFNMNTLFVVDECHIDEPLHVFAKDIIAQQKAPVVYTSATPNEEGAVKLNLEIATLWSIEEVSALRLIQSADSYRRICDQYHYYHESLNVYNTMFDIYKSFVGHYLANANPFAKSLIFVNTQKEVEIMVNALKPGPSGPVVGFWSGHTDLPDRWSIVVTTSVSDVGVTLPSVDHVFTTNSRIDIRLNKDGTRPEYSLASAALLKQRRGRTGRTNNGRFILFEMDCLAEYKPLTFQERLASLMQAGVSFSDIFGLYRKEVIALVGNDPEKFRAFAYSIQQAEKSIFEYARTFETKGGPNLPPNLATRFKFANSKILDWVNDLAPALTDSYFTDRKVWSLFADIGDFLNVALSDKYVKVEAEIIVNTVDERETRDGPSRAMRVSEDQFSATVFSKLVSDVTITNAHLAPEEAQDKLADLAEQQRIAKKRLDSIVEEMTNLQADQIFLTASKFDSQVWRFYRFFNAASWTSVYESTLLWARFCEFAAQDAEAREDFNSVIRCVKENGGDCLSIQEDDDVLESLTRCFALFDDYMEEQGYEYPVKLGDIGEIPLRELTITTA